MIKTQNRGNIAANTDEAFGIPIFVQPSYFRHFNTYTNEKRLECSKPVFPDLLKSDSTFKNILRLLRENRIGAYDSGRNFEIVELQRIIHRIDDYLGLTARINREEHTNEIKSFEMLLEEGEIQFKKLKAERDSLMNIDL